MYATRSSALIGFEALVRRHQGNPSQILQAAGLSSAVLYDQSIFIPYQTYSKLLEAAAATLQLPDFGLRLGGQQSLDLLGALTPHLCLQETVADAFAMILRNLQFHARGIDLLVSTEEQQLIIDVQFRLAAQVATEQLYQQAVSNVSRCLAELVANQWQPKAIMLSVISQKLHSDDYGLGCDVEPAGEANRVIFDLGILREPVSVRSELRNKIVDVWISSQHHQTAPDLAADVSHAIRALLPTGQCSLATIARLLNMSERVLQKRLHAQNTSYGDLLRAVRIEICDQFLGDPRQSITDFSLSLGYEEVAVFSRAFKQWKGVSPRAWIKARKTA